MRTSTSSYSSKGSTSSYRSITPTTPKPPPPPTAQPVKSALKQPNRGGARNGDPRFGPKLDPREELMIAIRNAGGRNALNKVGFDTFETVLRQSVTFA